MYNPVKTIKTNTIGTNNMLGKFWLVEMKIISFASAFIWLNHQDNNQVLMCWKIKIKSYKSMFEILDILFTILFIATLMDGFFSFYFLNVVLEIRTVKLSFILIWVPVYIRILLFWECSFPRMHCKNPNRRGNSLFHSQTFVNM